MKKIIYNITVANWEKYNGAKKKGHKCILISTGFLTDAKISTLPAGGKLLYLGLLLRCGEVTSSSIEASHDLLVTFAGGSGQVVSRLLDQLQSLQLLTYEKRNFLFELNRKEENRKEENRSSDDLASSTAGPLKNQVEMSIEKPKPEKSNIELNRKIWAAYATAYQNRWKHEPVRNATVNGQISSLGKRLGEEAVEVIAFYLTSNNSYYVKKCHPVGLCLQDAEALRTQWLNGKPITDSMVRTFEKRNEMNEYMKRIDEEGI